MSEWDQVTYRRLQRKLGSSAIFLAFFTDAWRTDPTCLVQLGVAMMLEKPIYLTIPKGTKIPRAIARIADGIEEYTGPEDASLAVERIMARAQADGYLA